MQGVFYVLFKLDVENLANPSGVIQELDYGIDALEIEDTEIVEAAQINPGTINVCVRATLQMDMELQDIQECLDDANYHFDYDDGHQSIKQSEMLGIFEDQTTGTPTVDLIPGEDLFSKPELWPGELGVIINHYTPRIEETNSYQVVREFKEKVEAIGFTFSYGLDGVPFELRRNVWPQHC
jgi:hypothetical protein